MIAASSVQNSNGSSNQSILDKLLDSNIWNEYIQKKEKQAANNERVKHYQQMFSDSHCVETLTEIGLGVHEFTLPVKKLISKFHAGKKRTVYTYREDEMLALRVIAYLSHEYDGFFSDSLYSFRTGYGVRDAIAKLRFTKNIDNMYGYKTDIHNYFNSIDVGILLEDLKVNLLDRKLIKLFESLLLDKRAVFNGEVIEEDKGVMAGTPISPFLANFYLRDVDEYFTKKDCIYMRYADDILILAKDKVQLNVLRDELVKKIAEKKLEMNPKKEQYFLPGEPFNFLGFSISKDRVDISPVTICKLKGKIRRSTRSIRRWMLDRKAPVKGTIKAMIRTYNQKFFGPDEEELTWARWFFPIITTDESLRVVDNYLQEHLRYIATGRFNKKNYDIVPYEMLKECGYRALVSEYHSLLESKKRID